jgi:glutathione S-transferase
MPLNPAYKNKDALFVEFLADVLPAHLQKLETHLKKAKTKYLCGDHPTLADFAIGNHLIRIAFNPKFANEHIMRAVISRYPLA